MTLLLIIKEHLYLEITQIYKDIITKYTTS